MTGLFLFAALLAQPAPGHVIAGRVVDALSGQPLERVHLFLTASGTARKVAETKSGEGGTFRFVPVPAGKYALNATRNGYGGASYGAHRLFARYSSAIVVGPGVEAEELEFRMHPSAVITGQATNENNEGIPGLQVFALRITGEGAARRGVVYANAYTDDRGRFRLHTLSSGRYIVASSGGGRVEPGSGGPGQPENAYPTAFAPGVADAAQAAVFELAEGGTAEATLHLRAEPAMQVSGLFEDGVAAGIPYVVVSTPVFQGQLPARKSTQVRNGRFLTEPLTPGRYRFTAIHGTRAVVSREVMVETDRQRLNLNESAPAAVTLRMAIRNGSGRSVAMLSRLDGLSTTGHELDANGEARIEALAAGAYALTIRSGMSASRAPLAVRAEGAVVEGSTVIIPELGEVTISATLDLAAADVRGFATRDGKPKAGLLVLVVRAEAPEDESGYRLDQSDSDGSFTWRDLAAGRYLAFCFDGGDETELGTKANVARWLERAQALTIGADRREPVRIELTRPAPEK